MQNPFLTSWIKAYLSYLSLALIWPASVQSEGQLPINCVDSGYFQRKQITTSLFMIANLLFSPNISYCSNLSGVVWFCILPARTAMEVQTSSPCYRQHLNEQLNGPCNVETIMSLSETRPHWWIFAGQGVYCAFKDQLWKLSQAGCMNRCQSGRSLQERAALSGLTELYQNMLHTKTTPGPGAIKNLISLNCKNGKAPRGNRANVICTLQDSVT